MDSRTSGTLRRKFSYGFSDKNSYSDIFSGTRKVSSRVEDYSEIFGGAGSSSIPVLDLSVDNNDTSESVNFRSSDVDYSNIFGGFGDEGIGVSYEELVYSAEVRGERILSGNSRTGSATVSPSNSSDQSSFSKENQLFSSKASYLSFDDEKQFNMSYHKTGVGSKVGSNGTIHVAECHPEPGFTCFVDDDSTSQKSKANKPDSSVTSDICRKLDFSDGLLEGHHTKKAMPHPDTQKPNRRQVNSATGFNQDRFYSNDKLLNAHVINLENNPINERLSPDVAANLENSNGFTKRSTVSNSVPPKGIASEQTTSDGSLPFFDQELDVNSDAAVSAAALGDAILKAQESIRVAKELMERKKAVLRSHPNRDINGLKVDDRKENTTAHGGNRTRNNNVKDTCESVDSFSNVFSRMGWKGALRHGTDAPDFKDSARISILGKVISDVHSKSLDTTTEYETAPSTMSGIEKKTAAVLSSNEQSVSMSKIRQFMEKYNYEVEERTVNKETLTKQVIVEKEEDEKAHDLGFIKGKVHAVIMETETEKNVKVKLACNVHEHVAMETPPIFQEDEDCEKTLLELKYTDYEKMMHKTQEQDQNKQHTNSQEEHFEKRAESNKEESKCTTRNILDVEVERFEDAIEWIENENEPKSTWDSESDGKEKKVNHMAEDVESEWGHLTIDEKRSRVHDAEESGENFRRFELKGSANDVRSSYADEKTENIEIKSEEVQVLQQAHYNNSMSRESDPCIHNASDNNVESQGVCQSDMTDDNYSKTKQQVDDKCRSIDKATKDFYDLKVGEAEAKIVCTELSENASLGHDAAEGCETRSNMKTIFEVLPSEESTPKFGLTEIELENTEAEQRDRDFESNINSDIGAQVLVNRSIEMGYIFEESKIHCEEEAGKVTHEIANGEGQHVVIMKNSETYSGPNVSSKNEKVVEVDKEIGARQNTQMKEENVSNTTAEEDEETEKMKTENDIDDNEGHPKEVVAKNETESKKAEPKRADENVYLRKISEENKRERQREKDRIVVERAIQEARDRAFAEARERAAEARQRVMTETRGKLEKSTTTAKTSADKASTEAKIRSERAAVERATAEARQRALEKALSQKAASRADADKSAMENVSASFRDTAAKRSDGNTTESTQRSKARLERQERIMERAAKALAEKNMRDLLVQKEEAEKNRLAESLDTEIKRWSSGKEGNLRALLSTLQYILSPGSGWQPISLTDIITTNAVKKAYRKATLYVHPDKLQQRGASIREKYICEKVFDLLKVAWNRFNSEER